MKVYQRTHKQGPRWCCDIHVVPLGEDRLDRFRLTAPTNVTTQAAAERWARQQFTAIASKGRPANTRKARAALVEQAEQAERERVPTLGEWWPQYEAQLALERRKESGQLARRFQWRWLAQFETLDLQTCCSVFTVRRVQAALAASAKAGPRRANQIVSLFLTVLRRAASTHPHLGLVVPTVKPIRIDSDDAVVCYPLEHTSMMLGVATVQERAAILLMLDAGLRAGEVCALRWCDVDFAARQVSVRGTVFGATVTSPKSGKARTVPITQRLTQALAALGRQALWVFPPTRRDGPGSFDTLAGRIRRVCSAAKVPHLGSHALRHTYATESLRAGVDLRTLQDRLGHSQIAVTALYLHAANPEARVGLDVLEARLTGAKPSGPATVTDLALARKRRSQK